MIYKRASSAWAAIGKNGKSTSIFAGDSAALVRAGPDSQVDLTVTSPPYCMGKEYEGPDEVDSFIRAHELMLPEIVRITKVGGSIAWQVGNYVRRGTVVPLDFIVYDLMRSFTDIKLRNRIAWTFGSGLHCHNRFSGRHETILWFTKGDEYVFDLDAVRVPQKYPGKKSSRGANKGEYSGNPLGKNPSDVWEIPNVKANHAEKTVHPCQFPVALVQRLVRALTPTGGVVFDPYMGSGSSAVAAAIEGRRFIGAEVVESYVKIASERVNEANAGRARIRPIDLPIYVPSAGEKVAQRPANFVGQFIN